MSTITISRQLGSLGCEVAQDVATALGYRVMQRELINEAARRAGVPEMALHAIDELGLLPYRPEPEALQAYSRALHQIIEELANEGGVIIVGRAGQVILKGRSDVLHVRIIAPAQLRAQRLAEEHGIPFKAACAQVKASDRSRKQFLKRFYQVDWDDPALYDLVISTERLAPVEAAGMITSALAGMSTTPTNLTDFCID